MKVLVAGATGVIGSCLAKQLRGAGYDVFGTTRSLAKTDRLRAAGVTPIIVDVFDPTALAGAVAELRPEIVIHQLTDLPPGLDPSRMPEAIVRNARIRSEGTRNLVQAALAAVWPRGGGFRSARLCARARRRRSARGPARDRAWNTRAI